MCVFKFWILKIISILNFFCWSCSGIGTVGVKNLGLEIWWRILSDLSMVVYLVFFLLIIHLLLKENFESLCFVLFDWFEWRGSITTVGVRNMRIKIWWKIVFYPLMTESFIVLLSLKLIFRLLSAFGCWKEKRQGNEAFGSLCLLLVLLVSVAMKNLRKKNFIYLFFFFSL